MRGIWRKIKRLIKKVVRLVKELISTDDELKDIKEDIRKKEEDKEYRKEVIKNFKEQRGHSVPHFNQQQVNKFNQRRVVRNSEQLEEEERKRDDLLSSIFSGFPQATAAIADTVWEVMSNLPKTIFETLRANLYKILEEKGETKIIKPSINPEKFYGKYSGRGKNYLDLFNERERNFLSMSLNADKIDIQKRAEALVWYYDKENDLEWGNIFLSRLNNCDPIRRTDLRSAYIDIFNEVWDNEEEKMYKKSVFDLARASDDFFNEALSRMDIEKRFGIEWFKDAYGREFIEN